MGQVYAGTAPNGSSVAVKLLRRELANHPEVRRRFTREARAAAKLEHPHIVRLIDFSSDQGEYYIVMEQVTGGSLAAWRKSPPDSESLWLVIHQMLQALSYAHARGVIHRDLKPENVLLDVDAEGQLSAKLMDFGVVFFRDERDLDMSGGQSLVGTPAYMSPEQALNLADASPATDLYAIGVMLFEFLTGRRPFEGTSTAGTVVAHMNNPIPSVTLRDGYRCDDDLDALLRRFLAKDPVDRFLFAHDARIAMDKVRVLGSPRQGAHLQQADAEAEGSIHTIVRPVGGMQRLELEPNSAVRLFGLREPAYEGRDAMLQDLKRRALEAVATKRSGISLVAGDMGLGKSRLLQHLRELVEEKGLMQVWAGVQDGRAEGPDVGFRQAMRRGLGVAGLNTSELRVRVDQLLDRHGIVDHWEVSATCELLLPNVGDGEPLLDTADATFALFGRSLARAYTARPVLLIIDDAHLGGGETLKMLRWLLKSRMPASWYAVVTYRPEYAHEDTGFAHALRALQDSGDPRVHELTLERMPVEQLHNVVQSCVPVTDALAQAIAMRAAGNPMIAFELVRHLVDSGRMEGFGEAPSVDDLLTDIPTAVGALIERRLEEASDSPSADAHTLEIWQRLAFLGLRFKSDLAQVLIDAIGLFDAEDAVDRATETGLRYGIFVGDEPDVLRFESGLLRDALLNQAGHNGAATTFQRAAGDAKAQFYRRTIAEHALDIARHYHLAEAPELAIQHYFIAAESAQARHRTDATMEALRAANGLAQTQPNGAPIRVRCETALADAFRRQARYDEARKHAIRAQAIAGGNGLSMPPESVRLLAEIARFEGKMRESRTLYAQAIEAFANANDASGVARSEFGLGQLELRDGRLPEAEKRMRVARDAFVALGDERRVAETLRELAETAWATGVYAEARTFAHEARRRFEALSDRRGAAICLLTLGEIARSEKSAAEASDLFDAARSELALLGDWHSVALALLGSGSTTMDVEGGMEIARMAFEEAATAFLDMGDLHFASVASLYLALVDAEAGRWNRAEEGIDAVMSRDREEPIDDPQFVGALVDLSRLALFAGRAGRARSLLETAAAKLERIGDQSPIYDRVDEVHYLLAELDEPGSLDEPTAVVDFFGDDD